MELNDEFSLMSKMEFVKIPVKEEMEQKPVVEMEFVKVDSIKEEVEEETPLAGVQPAAVWQEEMEQKPVVKMEFVKVDSIKEEVEEETPLAGVQPAAVWQVCKEIRK
ncbi:uncharacterized protein LOC134537912 isoform X6 [Bacillus rossius redtenbacheri]|uniref:uncharacterized protein LOC134537912 isoform X6 n=1 Tax=Bacillus rossius redtenbacheri TaxID=93214 RepID=UPI002FDE40FC